MLQNFFRHNLRHCGRIALRFDRGYTNIGVNYAVKNLYHCLNGKSFGATTLGIMTISITTLSIMTPSITTLSIMTLSITTFSITINNTRLSAQWQSVIMLSVIKHSVVMLNVTYKPYMLNVVLLSVLPGTNNVVFLSCASVTNRKKRFQTIGTWPLILAAASWRLSMSCIRRFVGGLRAAGIFGLSVTQDLMTWLVLTVLLDSTL
jgi:hypothetical protein